MAIQTFFSKVESTRAARSNVYQTRVLALTNLRETFIEKNEIRRQEWNEMKWNEMKLQMRKFLRRRKKTFYLFQKKREERLSFQIESFNQKNLYLKNILAESAIFYVINSQSWMLRSFTMGKGKLTWLFSAQCRQISAPHLISAPPLLLALGGSGNPHTFSGKRLRWFNQTRLHSFLACPNL